MANETGRWVRINKVAEEPNAVELLSRAMSELALAQALVLIHGDERGALRYKTLGGSIRFDDDGEPVIWSEPLRT